MIATGVMRDLQGHRSIRMLSRPAGNDVLVG